MRNGEDAERSPPFERQISSCSAASCKLTFSPARALPPQIKHEGAPESRMHNKGLPMAMTKHRIYSMSFASVYPLYVAKAERKGRTKGEVDQIIFWLTGYDEKELRTALQKKIDFETFFAKASRINPARALIKGVVCGVRVEDIEEPLMQEIRYLDKLIDELARGKAMDKILRKE